MNDDDNIYVDGFVPDQDENGYHIFDEEPDPSDLADLRAQRLEHLRGTNGAAEAEYPEEPDIEGPVRGHTSVTDQFSPLGLAAILALVFASGALFGWLLTPTRQVREVFNYNYQISRAAAPRLAIDPGAALGIQPLPKLLPPTKKGGRHE